MTADMETSIRASRRRVARSRGALSGLLLMILGLWAALVPFIGPYFDVAYTPNPDDAWNWTAARGWLEVLPGAAAFGGGLLLLLSASRAMTVFGGWLAALGGAWLIVGPPLADVLNLDLGQPDPTSSSNTRALTSLLFFFAIGAAILFVASVALGRVSVLSVRDVRAAERRAEAEEAERQAALEAAAAQDRERRRADEEAEAEAAGRHADDGWPEQVADEQRAQRGGLFHRHDSGEAGIDEGQRAGNGTGQPVGQGNAPAYPPAPQYQNGAPQAPQQPSQQPSQQPYPSAPPPREG